MFAALYLKMYIYEKEFAVNRFIENFMFADETLLTEMSKIISEL